MCSNQDSEPQEAWDEISAICSKRRLNRSEEEDSLDDPPKSTTGFEVNFSSDLPEPLDPEPLVSDLAAFSESNRDMSEDCVAVSNENVEQSSHTITELSNRYGATSTVNAIGLGLANDSSPSFPCRSENVTTKVSDWLDYGFLNPSSPMTDYLRPDNRGTDRPFPSRRVALSMFPPRSPFTGNREYTPPNSPFLQSFSPISPLNNGRDVYGNYIPSNTRDYFTTQLLSSSPNSQPINKHKTPSVSGKSSSTSRLHGFRWDKLKSLWKVADTQVFGPRTNPHPLQLIPNEDFIPQETPIVTYARWPINQAPLSICSRLLASQPRTDLQAVDSVKSRPSTCTSRSDAKETNSQTRAQQLADTNCTPTHNIHSNAITGNGKITPRDEKRWHKDNLPPPPRFLPAPPPQSVRAQQRNVNLSLYAEMQSHGVKSLACNKKDCKPNNGPRNESPGACRKDESIREMRFTERQERPSRKTNGERQENLGYREEAHKQKHDLITAGCEDGTTKTITERDLDSRFELNLIVDSDPQSSKVPAASSRYLPLHSPIPVSPQYSNEQMSHTGTFGHAAAIPSPKPVASATIQKHQTSLHSALSKAGKLSRSVLNLPFVTGSKSGSQYHRLVDLNENEPTRISMSADSNGWPRTCDSGPRKEMKRCSREKENGTRKIEGLDPESYFDTKGSGGNEYLIAPAVSNDADGSQSAGFTKRQNVPTPGVELAPTSNLNDTPDQFQADFATRYKANGAMHSHQTTQEWLDSIVLRASTTTQPRLNRSSDSNDKIDHPSHPPSTPILSTHNSHASLDSATQEALFVAERIRQHDARFSADGEGTMIRSSFSSDSSDEFTQQEEEEEKQKQKREKQNFWGRQDLARVMASMRSYE
ncbi:hypothetical protein COCC4DRAFT_143937 [Bipolaris maydis ATCC 48331]|uniref:Uncharacterized protein n=2 Tax=Cochliobolus heterostrophus TaxID=5016 RepID=M2VDU6_COCH5|nr:uncharacterized protein COCC4DRAFT_143937 [Bipolaris maydis ATCC 48331]EMD97843.1 hypothetical protein COCHEDRAFT_1151423 [Bipolaris maydis C5]KAJ5031911.1 hypothetical protein J3E73DRAFT_387616 [Bipolaris maydis]ENI02760.1 hypothetical protein COCC4DRAFT_143937 [Bipolaris maydis ATCC 48331]KAJ6210817.1 hypothetical protein PSV09DRAFT_1151423 [Bipolaris maydis]KAJ6273227.1 hypothetical protein PSV08DRAFT_368740 [Bipolaris maydis]